MPAKNKRTPRKSSVTQAREELEQAAEKAAKKKLRDEAPPVDIFDPKDRTQEIVQKTLNTILSARNNRPTGFATLSEIQRSMIPLPHFYWRYLLASYGIPKQCIISLIGAEHIGKTTLGLTLAAANIADHGFSLWIETENKPFLPQHVWRLMDPNVERSIIMERKGLTYKPARTLDEMVEVMTEWVQVMRGVKSRGKETVCVPMSQTLLVFVDTLSKLMTPQEAVGNYDYAKYMSVGEGKKAAKMKNIGEGSNLKFATFVHEFMRKLPAFTQQYNVVIIFAEHQNDEVDMSGLSSFMPETWTAMFNKKKIGGRATNQSSAIQLIMAKQGDLQNEDKKIIGKRVRVRCDKNTFGVNSRIMSYELHMDYKDRLGENGLIEHWDRVLRMDEPMLRWMLDEKLLDLSVTDTGLWSCPSLGVLGKPAVSVVNAFHANLELQKKLGKQLMIEGYHDTVEEIQQAIADYRAEPKSK
jgi:RecA/RadA recombinase